MAAVAEAVTVAAAMQRLSVALVPVVTEVRRKTARQAERVVRVLILVILVVMALTVPAAAAVVNLPPTPALVPVRVAMAATA